MKLLFASDIHGSKYYAELVIKAFTEEHADKLILLGDLLYHGPRNPLTKDYNPMEVAYLLNKYKDKIIAVRGNCDSEVDQMVLDFPMMSDYTQLVVDNYTFFLTHGHIYNPEQLPNLVNNSIFVFGHIHIPIAKRENQIYILNPSSVSLPKENNPSSYATYQQGKIEVKTFDNLVIRELILE